MSIKINDYLKYKKLINAYESKIRTIIKDRKLYKDLEKSIKKVNGYIYVSDIYTPKDRFEPFKINVKVGGDQSGEIDDYKFYVTVDEIKNYNFNEEEE